MSNKFVYTSVALLIIIIAGATIPVGIYTSHHKGFDVCGAGDAAVKSPQVRLDLIRGETLSAVRKTDADQRYILGCSGPAVYKLYLF